MTRLLMNGDFSRLTHDPAQHYSSVLVQQGRMLLDSDFNESQAITLDLVESTTADLIGCCGGPAACAGFQVLCTLEDILASSSADWYVTLGRYRQQQIIDALDQGDILISAGRYYVGGIQCRLEIPILFSRQPDLPSQNASSQPGHYVVYLDVWRRHLTALDDPALLEVALGGVETCTRLKTVWQVRLAPLAAGVDVGAILPQRSSFGRLAARPDGAGLENHLYRVEVHHASASDVRLKWSRDNATRVSLIQALVTDAPATVQLHRFSDTFVPNSRAAHGTWVEIANDELELEGRTGQLLRVVDWTQADLVFLDAPLDPQLFASSGLGTRPKLRCWDGVASVSTYAPPDWLPLEGGLAVSVLTTGQFRAGDYWLIPARATDSGLDWPSDQELPLPPRSIEHNYCPLATIVVKQDGRVDLEEDLRCLFPPLAQSI